MVFDIVVARINAALQPSTVAQPNWRVLGSIVVR
jgi:hypothetical protein